MVFSNCSECNGTIKKIDDQHFKCDHCGLEFIECPKCKGRGYLEQVYFNINGSKEFDYIDCDECYGQGVIKK